MPSRELWIWEQDECSALVKALAEYNAGKPRVKRIAQCHIAKELGITAAAINGYFRGRKALNIELVQAVLKLAGIPVARISPRLDDEINLQNRSKRT
ncbi:helix-turn-helix domain-containing protein [Pseudomonas parakoreensis]|jgi:hypothetical protein